jgi:hypothetical protein
MRQTYKLPISEEGIDENLAGSFPASDPPSWNLGTDHTLSGTKTKTEQLPLSTGSGELDVLLSAIQETEI